MIHTFPHLGKMIILPVELTQNVNIATNYQPTQTKDVKCSNLTTQQVGLTVGNLNCWSGRIKAFTINPVDNLYPTPTTSKLQSRFFHLLERHFNFTKNTFPYCLFYIWYLILSRRVTFQPELFSAKTLFTTWNYYCIKEIKYNIKYHMSNA